MKKIILYINTYNRPAMLLNLLTDIKQQRKGFDVFLLIINDHSSADYAAVVKYLEDHYKGKYSYLVNPVNYGKKLYWRTTATGYLKCADHKFDYFIQVADDMRLVKCFFIKAIKSWNAINDRKKACLNIFSDYSRLMKPFWTSYHPHAVSFGKNEFIRTGWTDMCLISSGVYLDALNYTISPVDPRWSANKELSSGVGMQISRRLISMGYSIYSLKRSLVISDDHPSVMHPEHRKENKLISNHDMDKVTASMATMPGREESLKMVIASIIDQVDELRIYANNMHKTQLKLHITQTYLHHRKIKWFFSDDHSGDLGDAGKFYQVENIHGYHFTIDDDLIYPPDYVFTLIAAIERYERRCVVSTHGRTFPRGVIRSYYHSATGRHSCLRQVAQDTFAHVIGTGVLAYHTDTIRIPFEIFEATNMADIWFSKYCQMNKIPRVVLKHPGGWIKDTNCTDQHTTIYANNHNDDKIQTQVVNSIIWTLP